MKIEYHRKFLKSFAKLPNKIKSRFYERLRLFANDQYNLLLENHSVEPIYPHMRSINITGDYRALFEVIGDSNIEFMRIGTHSELYK